MNTLNAREAETLRIVKDTTLTHEQAMMKLSKLAEQYVHVFPLPEDFQRLVETRQICDLGEGFVPYAPRYILPDYEKLLESGCKFLRLDPPTNLFEAISALEIFYHHVPSVTHFPVFIGKLDKLLDRFITDENEAEAKVLIKSFLRHIDRTIDDSFCHANIGPEATRAGKLILEAELELQDAIPGLTLLYDPEITPDDFATDCVRTALRCAKPSFADHKTYSQQYTGDYGIASCYNALPIGGGSYSLTRMLLKNVAVDAHDKQDFFARSLPHAVAVMCEFMDSKVKFLVEEASFFRSNFLVTEGFVDPDRFTAMFGVVGLCECVNLLMEKQGIEGRFGHSDIADQLGVEVMEAQEALVAAHENPYCKAFGNRFVLHAQVGIDSDFDTSPGARIAIGDEPPLYDHLKQAGLYHRFFPSGVGDIFPFDTTASRNPESILDIIKGALKVGLRYFSTYSSDSDVIRITGYLVKRSDIEKLDAGTPVSQDTVVLGLGSVKNGHVLDRKVRSL
ncbi:MAG: YjjI family glycine radical enzyme [Pseudoflavonifractor sp.]